MISLHPHRHQTAPPQGPGRWSADGQQWFDEAGERWLPVVEGQDTLCIQLEDVYCRAECTPRRLGCPRAMNTYWREIWLRRVPK